MTTQPTQPVLKPCPFCGSGHPVMANSGRVWHMHCFDCGARGPNGFSEAEARRSWQTRAAVVEKLVEGAK